VRGLLRLGEVPAGSAVVREVSVWWFQCGFRCGFRYGLHVLKNSFDRFSMVFIIFSHASHHR
jgi:hypothetical protein